MGRLFRQTSAVELGYGSVDFGQSGIQVNDPPILHAFSEILEEQECGAVRERARASHGGE